jgi:hypothetical protein
VEQLLIEEGYLKSGYNPLSLNPFLIKKLLYNPRPLGRLIGRAYLEALDSMDPASEYIGRATMDIIERELPQFRDTPAGRRSVAAAGGRKRRPAVPIHLQGPSTSRTAAP